jgi:para-aminobenzoate synthetase component 1
MTRAAYHSAVARIHHHIAAGDVYQVNLTQRFTAPLRGDPVELFVRLARAHPMPRSAYLDAGGFQIVSNSPELFLERRGRYVATQPIKGTRRRGRSPEEDARLRRELQADAKERAEHVMIVDLERNDLGRVCRPGSVRVRTLAGLESYPSLHHLVSTVEGELRPDVHTVDVLAATFPGGSISGAPKIRAMELIDHLEPHARGVYTGALGLIDGAGDCHLNLPIRTVVTMGGRAYFGAGGGIVADSDADAEYAETLVKLEAILGALGLGARAGCAA